MTKGGEPRKKSETPPNLTVRISPGHRDSLDEIRDYYQKFSPSTRITLTRVVEIMIDDHVGHPEHLNVRYDPDEDDLDPPRRLAQSAPPGPKGGLK